MATDSPRRVNRISGNVVRSEPVSDKSVMESVVGFLQDFTLTKAPEDKEKVVWVQFEQAPVTDFLKLCRPSTYSSSPHSNHPSLLLTIGYTNGIQIWLLLEDGEAQEVMSLRQGPIRHFRFLVTPFNSPNDIHSSKRPLCALTEDPSPPHSYTMVKVMSLRHACEVESISCHSPVLDILSNERVLVVTVVERILVYDALTLKEKFVITNCYPSAGINPNPVSLGSRWIAYAEKTLSRAHQSCGGFCRDGGQSYAATFIHVAKSVKKGISVLGETLANSVANQSAAGHRGSPSNSQSTGSLTTPGVVSIIDTQAVVDSEVAVSDYWELRGLVAHFPAHQQHPISSLTFDLSGVLLLTTDLLGRSFHLYRILPHHNDSTLTTIHHLYILHRGETTSKVQSTCFTWDSRWVVVTTCHGTTHLFPVTCYGGPVNKRTHVSKRVVSRVSRFETSAGLDDSTQHLKKAPTHTPNPLPPVSVSSSCPTGSFLPPSVPPFTPSNSPVHKQLDERHNEQLQQRKQQQLQRMFQHTINPRLPPLPQPTIIHPLAQIKQSYSSVPSSDHCSGSSPPTSGSQSASSRSIAEPRFISTIFAPSRLKESPVLGDRRNSSSHNHLDSLFIATSSGLVTEHTINVRAASSDVDKVTEDSPIQVECSPRLCWNLIRCHSMKELKLPLSPTNPIISSFDTQVRYHHHHHHHHHTTHHPHLLPPHHQQDLLQFEADDSFDEEWLSQVEIVTHAAPHRRLWMGPQFTFKPLNTDVNKDDAVTKSSSSSTPSSTSSSSSSLASLSSSSHKPVDDVFDAKYLSTTCGKSKPVRIKGVTGASNQKKQQSTYIEACHSGSFSGQSSLESRWFDPVPFKFPANKEQDQKVKENLADAILDEAWPTDEGADTFDQSECSDSWAGCLGYEGNKNTSKS